MPAQRTMKFAAAALLLLLIANGRVMGMGDPRAPTDGAPLKREGVSFEGEQHERRNLAEVQQAASPQKDGPAQQGSAASSSTAGKVQPASAAVAAVPAAEVPANKASAAAAEPSKPAANNAAPAVASLASTSTPAAAAAAVSTAATGPGKQVEAPASKNTPDNNAAGPAQPKQQAPAREEKPIWRGSSFADKFSAMPRKAMDVVRQPQDRVQEMTLQELEKEDAPPTSCRWAPQTRGIKWNVGCADKPLGASCNGIVLSGPPYCEGKGGSIATIKCLPDGEWGEIVALC